MASRILTYPSGEVEASTNLNIDSSFCFSRNSRRRPLSLNKISGLLHIRLSSTHTSPSRQANKVSERGYHSMASISYNTFFLSSSLNEPRTLSAAATYNQPLRLDFEYHLLGWRTGLRRVGAIDFLAIGSHSSERHTDQFRIVFEDFGGFSVGSDVFGVDVDIRFIEAFCSWMTYSKSPFRR